MEDNRVVQGLWVGTCLSVMEKVSIESFIKHGHEYHLYVYEDVKGVPKEAVIKDASEIVSRERVFKDAVLGLYCGFSDIFRYKLLLERGGVWVDTDLICLRPFDFRSDYVFAAERTENNSEKRTRYGLSWVNNNVMKVPAGSEVMQFCYNTSLNKPNEGWGIELAGPIVTEAVNTLKLNNRVLPYKTFNPIDWWDWKDIINGKLTVRFKTRLKLMKREVYAVHLWSSMWKRDGADKDQKYHPACLYEKFKRMYL